jgi:hypothetical protein
MNGPIRPFAFLLVIFTLAGGCAASAGTHRPSDAGQPTLAERRMVTQLRTSADAAYDRKAYSECGDLLDRAAALDRFDRGLTSVNAACCYALAKDGERAFAALNRALERQYRRVDALEKDPDLSPLHADQRWSEVLQHARANLSRYVSSANPELYRMYEEDQADRLGDPARIDWTVVTPRDVQRRQRTTEMLKSGALKTAADYYHAAMIFQHGKTVDDFATAARLATRAAEIDQASGEARWLAAAAKDRELMTQGKPQRFGTQFKRVDGRWVLYQVDSSVTDDERAAWNVPSLAEAEMQAARMNAQPAAH